MPKQVKETVAATIPGIEGLKPSETRRRVAVKGVDGLFVVVAPTGRKTFVVRYARPDGTGTVDYTLGTFPAVTLQDAKAAALKVRGEASLNGVDAVAVKRETREKAKAEASQTVAVWVDSYLESRRARVAAGTFRETTLKREESTARVHIAPRLGSRPIKNLLTSDVETFRDAIQAERGAGAAQNAVALLSRVLERARKDRVISFNPCEGVNTSSRARQVTASEGQLRAIWQALETADEKAKATVSALKVSILTGKRRAEVANLRRSQWDPASKVWTIAREETKGGRLSSRRTHDSVLPVGSWAAELIDQAFASHDCEYAFTADGKKSINPDTMTQFLKRKREGTDFADITVHDLRRTLSTNIGGFEGVERDEHLVAKILDHAPLTVTDRVYNLSQRARAVRAALEAWESQVAGIVGVQRPKG